MVTRSRSQNNFSHKKSDNSHLHLHLKEEIAQHYFMNEIRTGMRIPGAPSSPTAIIKNMMLPYMGNAKMI